ncbi:hypothetical protein BDW22DRAFT_1339792 [Trametopsis cervina]|nr:hypothetical protein BDW22DRAFT_1339792 [Trametopsis cervina]
MSPKVLSEIAKGKQREIIPSEHCEPGPSTSEPPTKTLVVRFSEGLPDLTFQVAEKDTVRDVKRRIRDHRPQLTDHRLRLIHSGRLLADGVFLYSWLTSLEERQRRATAGMTEEAPDASQPAASIWLHCSVGPKIEPGEEDETRIQRAQLKPLRGFDRLTAAGFTPEDIANMRLQFHSQSATDFLEEDAANPEEYEEHARALEEQWIDSMDSVGGSSLADSSTETPSVILNGMILGFFFPVIPLFFFHEQKRAVFWEEGPAHDVVERPPLSKRVQMGIIIGFLMNMVFGIWTYALST